MDKITDITEKLKQQKKPDETQNGKSNAKVTNPIFKKLVTFANQNLTKKFDINDILK